MKIRDKVLPVLRPLGGEEEIASLRESIESGWWGKGPKVAEFEKKFAEMVGAKYAVAVDSNTSGQDLVLKALGIKDCDVVSPTISFMTTAIVPVWNNCSSTIVDVMPHDLNIDPDDVKKNLKSNTKLVTAVNYSGVLAPVERIREFYDGFILEDCAHACYAPGAGSRGDAAVWSFQAVKTMPCGDGGMITTNSKELYEKLLPLTWLGITSTYSRSKSRNGTPGYAWDYDVDVVGYKAYMIDLTAAICLEQMKKLEKHLEIRRYIQSQYNEKLNERMIRPPHSDTVQYYIARIPEYRSYAPDKSGGITASRDGLIDYLGSKNIHTSVHFKPLHKYGILRQTNYRDYPVADNIWESLISLPCHPAMTDEDIDYVIYWVNKYFEE